MKKQFSIEIYRNGILLEFSRVYCAKPERTKIYKSMLINKSFDSLIKIREIIGDSNATESE